MTSFLLFERNQSHRASPDWLDTGSPRLAISELSSIVHEHITFYALSGYYQASSEFVGENLTQPKIYM